MDPERAVFIDRWIGTPLCALATLLSRVFRRSTRPDEPPDALVFIEIAEIGALFVAYPALALARRRFPDAKIYFVTAPAGKEALGLMGVTADEMLLLRIDSLGALAADARRIRAKLARHRKLVSVNLEPFARFSSLLAWASGARVRVGFHRFLAEGNYTGDLLTHRVVVNSQAHASQTYLALVRALEGPPGREPALKEKVELPVDERLRVDLPDNLLERVRGKLREAFPDLTDAHEVIVLNANTSDIFPLRRWPAESFVALARALLEAEDRVVVLTGTAVERPRADALRDEIGDHRVINLAGETTLAELLALYRLSSLLITNDSGPAHFSGAVDAPALVLFGPENPGAWGPLNPKADIVYAGLACSPCISPYNHKQSSCTDAQCMKRMSVEEVRARAEQMLAG